MWQTIGHKNQKLFLDYALRDKKYAHAYLFFGVSQIGKKTLAVEFASKILGVSASAGTTPRINPDLVVLNQEQLAIADMRALISELSLKPYHYDYRVAILDNFENINEEAASSILKTLEEPNPSAILILIANNKKALLPTVISRTQALYFSRVRPSDLNDNQKDIKHILKDKQTAGLFNGKIGKAILYLNDPNFKRQLLDQRQKFEDIRNSDQAKRLLMIKSFSDFESNQLAEVFENWLDSEHFDFISRKPEKFKNINLLCQALLGLKQNLNKKLILQHLFLNIN